MKLYAQHGAQSGDKIFDGLNGHFVDGVIFSPRDISYDNLASQIARDYPEADRLFDPQYYTCLMASSDQVRLGYLPEDFGDYFVARRRLDLTRERQIEEDINRVLQFQSRLKVSHIISPNILISRSFDSREASIAIDFLTISGQGYLNFGDTRPLFLTLAISRDALLDRTNMMEFVNEITGLGINAQGYYLLIAANSIVSPH